MSVDYSKSLPPYRSLLNPNSKYDYQLHSLIPISQNELNNLKVLFQQKKQFKMKYKSLLNDVKNKITNINSTNLVPSPPVPSPLPVGPCFDKLPIEIQYHIFSFLRKEDLLVMLTVSSHFYKLSKKFIYKNVEFHSTFRFAQFITILRINNKLGNLLESIDLSTLKSEDDDEVEDSQELAGWRDWKYFKNPLYVSNQLTKIQSNSSIDSNNKKKRNFGFLRSKRNKTSPQTYHIAEHRVVHHSTVNASTVPHPKINRYLLNYASSKDLPIGFILHLIHLCPNLVSINLGNLSLLVDYEIDKKYVYKFQSLDIKNNYSDISKNLVAVDDSSSIYGFNMDAKYNYPAFDTMSIKSSSSKTSKASSRYIWKYNSLLTPTPIVSKERLFLSDVNLKSINPNFLIKLDESDILDALVKRHKLNTNFYHLDLSSMIWLNKSLVQNFLAEFVFNKFEFEFRPINLVIDLTNSGMYKDLVWAKRIDLRSKDGHNLLSKILKDDLLNDWEERQRDERIRRGRIAENYLH